VGFPNVNPFDDTSSFLSVEEFEVEPKVNPCDLLSFLPAVVFTAPNTNPVDDPSFLSVVATPVALFPNVNDEPPSVPPTFPATSNLNPPLPIDDFLNDSPDNGAALLIASGEIPFAPTLLVFGASVDPVFANGAPVDPLFVMHAGQ